MEAMYAKLLTGAALALALGLIPALLRAIRGPRTADRVIGVNLVTTLSTACIAVLAVLLRQSWLLDVGLIYCMMSFLAVVILVRSDFRGRRGPEGPGSEASAARKEEPHD